MKVNKFIKSKIERNYFFITGKVPIDTKYFIKEIEKGIKQKENLNFKTNLLSEMTSYGYFLKDKKLFVILCNFMDLIDAKNLTDNKGYQLADAWGFKQGFSHYTRKHSHIPGVISGAIMLSKHSQKLFFPEINETLECEPGSFALFSSFLLHKNERNITNKVRYGLSFNWYHKNI